MSKPALEQAREHVDPRWESRKVERELEALNERLGRRSLRTGALLGSLALASATVVMLLASDARAPTEPLASRAPTTKLSQPALPAEAAPGPVEPAEQPPLEPALALDSEAQAEPESAAEPASKSRLHKHKRKGKRATGTRVVVAGEAWRSLAREGRYHEAYVELAQAALDRAASDVDDLMLAGDAARLSGHPREAVPYYRDALARAGTGSRAHLAAFTLGRTLLRELGDARGAAQSFARAYTLAPHGPLAEEALAGEVESWARSGERTRAEEAARRYLAAFPTGRRLREVKRLGGLE
jgi:tetratricopeptide (TPR) repeat protein